MHNLSSTLWKLPHCHTRTLREWCNTALDSGLFSLAWRVRDYLSVVSLFEKISITSSSSESSSESFPAVHRHIHKAIYTRQTGYRDKHDHKALTFENFCPPCHGARQLPVLFLKNQRVKIFYRFVNSSPTVLLWDTACSWNLKFCDGCRILTGNSPKSQQDNKFPCMHQLFLFNRSIALYMWQVSYNFLMRHGINSKQTCEPILNEITHKIRRWGENYPPSICPILLPTLLQSVEIMVLSAVYHETYINTCKVEIQVSEAVPRKKDVESVGVIE